MAKVELRFNQVVLHVFDLDKPLITIGRSKKNDIVIDNMAVSRRHAKIYREGPRYIVEDLQSLNGTFVNNKKVPEWILSDNDHILIGKHTLVFMEEEAAGETTETDRNTVEETLVLETKKHRELLAKVDGAGPDTQSGPVEAGVVILSGGSGPQGVELTKDLTVAGKGKDADIKLRGLFLRKTVFLITRRSSGFYISNAGGRTSACLNGFPVKDPQLLRDGDTISAGRTRMQFYAK